MFVPSAQGTIVLYCRLTDFYFFPFSVSREISTTFQILPLVHDINVLFEKNAQRLEWNFRNDFILLSENWLPPPGSSNLPDKSGSDQDHVKTESMKTLGKHLFPTYCIIKIFRIHAMTFLVRNMDYRCPMKPFFIEIQNFWALADKLGTILALWIPCPWENVAGSFSYKKLMFLGLKNVTPKCSQNKILAAKNLGNSIHTSVFGAYIQITSILI